VDKSKVQRETTSNNEKIENDMKPWCNKYILPWN